MILLKKRLIACFFLSLFILLPALSWSSDKQEISWLHLLLNLFGGLALFLFGLEQLSEGLKKAAGPAMQSMLSRLTTNRVTGAVTGASVTAILNSSSVTTVLVVGFVSAGVMSLQQSVGIIMGANIGSTMTAQLLAFNISQFSLLPVAVGFYMLFTAKKDAVKNWGMMFMGAGLVFFGMGLMGEAMYPLRSYEPFLEVLKKMENPLLGIIAGACFTALVQSSAATVGIAIAMASGGLLSLTSGIGLALGANIGTCVTALMAAIGKPPEAIRAAVVHISFNIIGVLIWLPFISVLADIAVSISPAAPELIGKAKVAAEVPRQIANANTIFNVVNTAVFLPFTGIFAIAAEKLVRERPLPPAIITPLYLDKDLVNVPSMALSNVRRELTRTAELVLLMFDQFRSAFGHNNRKGLELLDETEEKVDILEYAVVGYLSKVRTKSLTRKESKEHECLMTCAVTLETLADVIDTELVELLDRAKGIDYKRSEKTRELLRGIYYHVREAIEILITTLQNDDQDEARRVIALQPALNSLQEELLHRKSERLGLGIEVPDAIQIARIEVSAADKMFRMYSLCKRVARAHIAKTKPFNDGMND